MTNETANTERREKASKTIARFLVGHKYVRYTQQETVADLIYAKLADLEPAPVKVPAKEKAYHQERINGLIAEENDRLQTEVSNLRVCIVSAVHELDSDNEEAALAYLMAHYSREHAPIGHVAKPAPPVYDTDDIADVLVRLYKDNEEDASHSDLAIAMSNKLKEWLADQGALDIHDYRQNAWVTEPGISIDLERTKYYEDKMKQPVTTEQGKSFTSELQCKQNDQPKEEAICDACGNSGAGPHDFEPCPSCGRTHLDATKTLPPKGLDELKSDLEEQEKICKTLEGFLATERWYSRNQQNGCRIWVEKHNNLKIDNAALVERCEVADRALVFQCEASESNEAAHEREKDALHLRISDLGDELRDKDVPF